jgi:hypothetical protein
VVPASPPVDVEVPPEPPPDVWSLGASDESDSFPQAIMNAVNDAIQPNLNKACIEDMPPENR